MKIILSIVGFVYLFCSTAVAQTNACPISGNYIGKSAVDLTISAIEIGENDNYVMKIYDLHRNLLRTCRGQWKCTTDTLQLDDKSGAVIYLKKHANFWYQTEQESKTCLFRFSFFKDENDFWEQLFREGC